MLCRCGALLLPSRSNNKKPRVYCSVRCKNQAHAAKQREQARSENRTCLVDDCARPAIGRRYCSMHYSRLRIHGSLGDPRPHRSVSGEVRYCSVEGCDRVNYAGGICSLHYNRKRVTGHVGPAHPKKRPIGEGYIDPRTGYAYTGGKDRRLRHRVVMEQMIGRPLRPFESVHHVNGIRSDNRPENLELWCKPQPAGQRAIDLARWVVETYPELVRQAA